MGKLISIETLAGSFRDENELQAYCNKQHTALVKAAERIKQLEIEVSHVKELLAKGTALINKEPSTIVSKEQALLESQINLIYNRSLHDELSLEETKRLDLLLKNLNLIKGQSTTIVGQFKKLDANVGKDELLAIAAQVTKAETQSE